MKNFLLTTVAPFLRKRGAIIVIVLFVVCAVAILAFSHAKTGPIPSPWGN